tara:strand:+ start:181 stop:660 length:480 start_codon:yes stop_codon:yes gene_type:complete
MSTIKVDTIQKADGTSQIGIDKIGGVASAGTIAVIAEGGTNTTNLAQGLCKVWLNFEGDASGIPARDSFNVSSTDDDGTGDYGVNFTSSFANNDYAGGMIGIMATSSNNDVGLIGPSRHAEDDSLATGSIQLDGQKSAHTDGTARDVGTGLLNLVGDLA